MSNNFRRMAVLKKKYEFRESSFNMAGGGGGDEDIETRSFKF